jgi:hypothetical protein
MGVPLDDCSLHGGHIPCSKSADNHLEQAI